MDKIRILSHKGQILIIVALMILGLMAMLGLVIDGGNAYFHRRQAQLAADAGALAGARAYCLTEEVAAAEASAWEYAVDRNDIDNADTTVDETTGDVTVETRITYNTFFVGLLGQDQSTATAKAVAACTPPTTGHGIMPVAYSCTPAILPGDLEPEPGELGTGDCELLLMDHFEDPGDELCTFGEDPYYIVVDSDQLAEDIVCEDPTNPGGEGEEGVSYVDCDFNDDGQIDILPISAGNKSWLDLDGGGGGAADLKDWVENGLDETVAVHTWFTGETGVVGSVYDAIYDHQLGNDVIIPVFDLLCGDDPRIPEAMCEYHSQDTVVTGCETIGCRPGDYFHIISFVLFHVECIDQGSHGPCPANEYLIDLFDLPASATSIEGCFVDGFDAGLGGGEGEVDLGTYVIYLKE
jgi:hypothetical protein